jgi:glutamate dehydrogenase
VREAGRVSRSDDPAWDEALLELEPGPGTRAFIERLPPGYRSATEPAQAAEDLREVAELTRAAELTRVAGAAAPPAGAALDPPGDRAEPSSASGEVTPGPPSPLGVRHRLVVRPSADPACSFRLRRFGPEGVVLTTMLPLLESFGLVVVESLPMRLAPGPGGEAGLHIDDIGLRAESPHGPEALRFVPAVHGARLVEAIEASAIGWADIDSLNRLVTLAGLDWRQTSVLRAYLRYWRQSRVDLGWEEMAAPLAEHPDVARALVGWFQARFDPSSAAKGDSEAARALVVAQLNLVTSLQQDRVLRAVLELVDATLRTNYFARTGPDEPLVLKFDSRKVPDLPRPRPAVEAFVHGPGVEGVHLRAGLIARGGLRWSERPTDFRTEILDLAFAQVKKNSIIVPTGAKGGFVCRGNFFPGPDEVRRAYERFVAALLSITDNLVGGQPVTPRGVVALDGPDPYLVVAADKGTATFSDLANSIAERVGFWLGDAFASGGSRGYDHKAMGITARGAWVAVRRHFRELGVDVAVDPIRVAGVGDMSGDVFGNGMLRSKAIHLVAAFDHRHVFLDPTPDGDIAFEERRRLFELPRSSWADYRPELISPGGGVWPRDAKSIPLSAPARAALGVEADSLSPPEVISAILCAPVDLLWFGGIGTYVKAPEEADTDVGDHANDAVRVTADRVRARVVAEGANLGVTQAGRIRYSRRGGRINADFIDNAAGVATSDREVNLKILLALAIERGRLDPAERDRYLSEAEEEVAAEVLRQVDHSVAALNRASADSDRYLDAYENLIDDLEAAGRFDRQVEHLPDAEEFSRRREAGAGLIRPELAAVLTFAKTELVAAVEGAPWSADPFLADSVLPYFPGRMREELGDLIPEHRLYRPLVATDVAGEVVDQMGIVWAHDLAAELGRPLGDVAAAFWASRHVTGAAEAWGELEQLADAGTLGAPAEAALHAAVVVAVARQSRRFLAAAGPPDPAKWAASVPEPLPTGAVEVVSGLSGAGTVAPGRGFPPVDWVELGVSPALADRFAAPSRRVVAAELGRLAAATGRTPAEVAQAWAALDQATGLPAAEAAVAAATGTVPPPGRLRAWHARAIGDDLAEWRRDALARILTADPGDPRSAVEAWAADQAAVLERAARVAPGRAAGDPLASATLMLRRLRPGPS